MLRAEAASPGEAAVQSNADIPEGYEIGEKSLSPNGRFAILYPIRGDDTAELPPNLLVCLKPYSVLTRIGTEGGRWQGARGQPLAKWNGNSIVAIWAAARWGWRIWRFTKSKRMRSNGSSPSGGRCGCSSIAIFESAS